MEPIEPPWQAVKEWIPDDDPNLDWFNRPRNPSSPPPEDFDQRPAWQPEEIPLGDGRTLVLDDTDWNNEKIEFNPPGSHYGMVMQKVELLSK